MNYTRSLSLYAFVLVSYLTSSTDLVAIPLLGAARLGSPKFVRQQLICNKEDPNQQDEYGNTPLHYAVHLGSREVSNLLLEYNAHATTKNNKGKTALHIAVQGGHDYIARRLLVYGADPNAQDNEGNTPLHIAAQKRFYRSLRDLIKAGAQSTVTNNNDKTALQLAQMHCPIKYANSLYRCRQQKNCQEILTLLKYPTKAKLGPSILDKQFIQCAKTNNVARMRRLIRQKGLNCNQQVGRYGRTALMYAARNKRTQMIKLLLNEAHVDPHLVDSNGDTALDYARKHDNNQLSQLLQS